ncbi:hypothetical protein [Kaarinaea lacus]
MQCVNLVKNNKKEMNNFISFLGNSALAAILTTALLYSSGTLAGNNEITDNSRLALNGDKTALQTKTNISQSKMTPENRKNIPASDNQIGLFSIEDGAMMGHYGDGEYAD